MNRSRGAAGLLIALALTATAGCTGTVEGSEVEQQVVSTAKKQGITAEDVSCPDLKAEKGERTTCTFTVQGQEYRLVAEVRGVDGNRVDYYLDAPTVAK